ncbi:RHS repeat-associated core domain-containing protein [Pseudomonas sp. NPDC089752]|uniref:RHS repeat-associated core domain-containing protein n=1 Tax=Pseudomonas sp. NPDC089752 TaxID=3364472 RepID=UPI0038240D99
MPASNDNALHRNTPTVTVTDNRGLVTRVIRYHRHPDTPSQTHTRITRQRHDARGFINQSSDPRLHDGGRANFTCLNDLAGRQLCTHSVDAGVSINLSDSAGRPFLAVTRIALDAHAGYDRNDAITRLWHYENADLPGRLLGHSEQVNDQTPCRLERLVYAGNSSAEKAHNLAGQAYLHYHTAGLQSTQSFSLTGVPLSTTQRLMAAADNPQARTDWDSEQPERWEAQLQPLAEANQTLSTVDATGQLLTLRDAAGHQRRQAYDVSGQLIRSWLTLAGGREQVIVDGLSYSAAGKKLREVHGNGLVTLYDYHPRTQRLATLRTERPTGHALGVKLLQDLRYAYDRVGNVVGVRDKAAQTRFWRNQEVEPHSTFVYDSLYQLVSATGREMANAGQQGVKLPVLANLDNVTYTRYSRTYNYDSAGNLIRIRHQAPASNHGYTIDITVSDRSNRAVQSTLTRDPAAVEALFNASGQQTTLSPGQQLTWTPCGALHTVTPVAREVAADDSEHYRYDIANQRQLKVSTRMTASSLRTQRVQYLPGLELRSVLQDDMPTQMLQVVNVESEGHAQVRALHWVAGKPPALPDDQLRYSYADPFGSGCLEIDGSGAVISQESYYPYGGTAVWAATSEVQGRYKFIRYSGKERDATGLYYYGHRYYQPWLGRWLSADPAGTIDGLNVFSMVNNNPMTMRDEQGLMLKSVANFLGFGTREPQATEATQATQAADSSEGRHDVSPPPSPSPGPSRDSAVGPPTADLNSGDVTATNGKSSTEKNRLRNQKRKAAKALEREIKADLIQTVERTPKPKKMPAAPTREYGTRTSNVQVYERLQSGLPTDRKGAPDQILAIGQRPSETNRQEIIFLERGNGEQGFKHITGRHRAEFNEMGIETDNAIRDLVMTALVQGTIVGIQGKTAGRPGRPIYEVAFQGRTHNVAVQLMDNNSVLGANPKHSVSAREKAALKPAPILRQ